MINSIPFKLAKRYRVFLSSTFLDLKELRRDLIKQLLQANLFYFAMENLVGDPNTLQNILEKEIENSDIYILLICETKGSGLIDNLPVTQFEFNYARKLKKTILAYFTDNGTYGAFAADTKGFKDDVTRVCKYAPFQGDKQHTISVIMSDIINVIVNGVYLTYWSRPDMDETQIADIIKQRRILVEKLDNAHQIIANNRKYIAKRNWHNVIGSLLKSGIYRNHNNQSFEFMAGLNKNSPVIIQEHEKYEYKYYVDRFEKYSNDVIYDKKLGIYWYFIKNLNFTWEMAVNYFKTANHDQSKLSEKLIYIPESSHWRMPSIRELMTLLTKDNQENLYIDKIFATRDVHWFWSSDLSGDRKMAYYIETKSGKVLKDSIASIDPHKKAALICTKSKPKNTKKIVVNYNPLIENQQPSDKIYEKIIVVYLSSLLYEYCNREEIDLCRFISQGGYYPTSFSLIGSRNGSQDEVVREELRAVDYLLVLLHHTDSEPIINQTKLEIKIANELKIPIITFKYTPGDLKASDFGYDLHGAEPSYIAQINDFKTNILATLNTYFLKKPRMGWIRHSQLAEINQSIEKINQMSKTLVEGGESIELFIKNTKITNLREIFEQGNILFKSPTFGSRIKFVSIQTPFSRLIPSPNIELTEQLPILYLYTSDRFQRISDESQLVADSYLNLFWNTKPIKHLSFSEAERIARECCLLNKKWRLPTVIELMTLLTPVYGERKYMDEYIFPVGRWFWTSTMNIINDKRFVYFVDFNYFYGSIDHEEIPDNDSLFENIRRKSALLVTEFPDSL